MDKQEQRARWEAAVSDPAIIKKHLDAVRAARCRKIMSIDTGIVYESQADFAREFNVNPMMVNHVLRGRRKTVCGQRLAYYES